MTDRTRFALVPLLIVALTVMSSAVCAAALRISAEVRATDGTLDMGWISVTLNNPTSRPVKGRLDFMSYGNMSGANHAYVDVAAIGPGETRILNIPAPLVTQGSFTESDGSVTPLNLYYFSGDGLQRSFLFVGDSASVLTTDEIDDFTRRVSPGMGGVMSYGSGSGSGTTRTLLAQERIVTQMPASELPENWLCYLPLKYVFLSQDVQRQLTAPQNAALNTWLNLGGNLVVYGTDKDLTIQKNRGEMIYRAENPVTDPRFIPNASTGVSQFKQRYANIPMPFQDEESGGRGGALFLTTLFLIVAGPLNYFYFSRKSDIRKLIITLPVISVGFCSLIIGYFILTQGFNRKGGSLSVTTVDEQANEAVTFASHSLLSGLYPGGGFHFDAHTYFQPTSNVERNNVEFDLTREIVLKEGLFQPGRPFNYMTILPHTTRERMIINADATELRNGFELPVKAVAVLSNGQFAVGGAAAPGAAVSLTATQPPPAESIGISSRPEGNLAFNARQLAQLLAEKVGLNPEDKEAAARMCQEIMDYPDGNKGIIYAAVFDGIPKSSQPGVEISDGSDLHILIGLVGSPEAKP